MMSDWSKPSGVRAFTTSLCFCIVFFVQWFSSFNSFSSFASQSTDQVDDRVGSQIIRALSVLMNKMRYC